ncbi:DUF4349 domain-containing protein [Streptomyces sp. bgisy022]|uniref:DUF4349 domain-containing protein n=1 Tax=Streptomyces sp. bgisy022 TaxID=3413769 RepID=UPI003D74958F
MRIHTSARPAHALAGVLLTAALAVTGCGAGDDGGGADGAAGTRADAPADAGAHAGADTEAGAGSHAGANEKAAPEGARQGAPGGTSDTARSTAPPRAGAQHVIRTATLTVRVDDVPEALEQVRTTTEDAGGYIGDETTDRDRDGHERTRVVLRVPVAEYTEVLSALEGTGTLVRRTAKAQDVTDQVVDVESRIKTQRASVARVRELMDRATKLSDVVTLEGELSTRQADLEALLARQASLKDRTGLATLTLTLSENRAEEPAGKDEDPGFLDALAGGWNAFLTLLRWIAVGLGAVLPFAAALALLALLWRWAVRPRLPRRPRPTPAGAAPGPLPTAPPVARVGGQPERSEQSERAEQSGGED